MQEIGPAFHILFASTSCAESFYVGLKFMCRTFILNFQLFYRKYLFCAKKSLMSNISCGHSGSQDITRHSECCDPSERNCLKAMCRAICVRLFFKYIVTSWKVIKNRRFLFSKKVSSFPLRACPPKKIFWGNFPTLHMNIWIHFTLLSPSNFLEVFQRILNKFHVHQCQAQTTFELWA